MTVAKHAEHAECQNMLLDPRSWLRHSRSRCWELFSGGCAWSVVIFEWLRFHNASSYHQQLQEKLLTTGTRFVFEQGPDFLKKANGLHNFMSWKRGLLTVSFDNPFLFCVQCLEWISDFWKNLGFHKSCVPNGRKQRWHSWKAQFRAFVGQWRIPDRFVQWRGQGFRGRSEFCSSHRKHRNVTHPRRFHSHSECNWWGT